jgi:hypothetical protein
VKVAYNPNNRPNKFNKKVTVTSNARNLTTRLSIAGNVIPTPNKLRASIKKLRIEKTKINLNLKDSDIIQDSLKIQNTYREPIKIEFNNLPEYLKLVSEPEILQPQERGTIIYSYNTSQTDFYGNFVDKITVIIHLENSKDSGNLFFSTTIKEDFSYLTEKELLKAPKIFFPKTTIDYGSAIIGEKKYIKFQFQNQGKSKLIIRNIQPKHGCFLQKYDKSVKPGKSGEIEIFIEPNNARKKFNNSIKVISNDPKSPVIVLRINGDVYEENIKTE